MQVQFLESSLDSESTREEHTRSAEQRKNTSSNNGPGDANPLTVQEEPANPFRSFKVQTSSHVLCWILTKTTESSKKKLENSWSQATDGTELKVLFQSTTFCTTLDSGWMPSNPIELVNALVADLQKHWKNVCTAAMSHLEKTV